MFALPQDDIIVLTKNTFKTETDDNSDVELDFLEMRQKVYISDSSGLKFTAVEDLLEDSPNTDHGQMFTYVTRLFNFKGVLALSRQKMDFLRDNSKEGSLELVIDRVSFHLMMETLGIHLKSKTTRTSSVIRKLLPAVSSE